MGNSNWTKVVIFGLVALVVFALGIGVLFLLFGGGWGMTGPGMMRPRSMRGGWCPWCGGTGRLGGGLLGTFLGLTLACFLPLALLALLVAGSFWLVRSAGNATSQEPAVSCPTCGRPVEHGWQACPYCGEDLQGG